MRDEDLQSTEAPLVSHLAELRSRIIRGLIELVACSAVAYCFREQLFLILTDPLFAALRMQNLEETLTFRTLAGAFLFHFKAALVTGVFVASPFLFYELWQFVAPGLYKRERRAVMPLCIASSICFVGGALFAYFLVLPDTYAFLLGYAVDLGPQKMMPDINIEEYLGFTLKLLLAFGIAFELPVAVACLAQMGLVTHRTMVRFGRFAIVLAFVFGALLTPPDVISQLMLALPLAGLYGLSIGIAYLFSKRREKANQDLQPAEINSEITEDSSK